MDVAKAVADKLGVKAGNKVKVTQGSGSAVLVANVDKTLPSNAVRVAAELTGLPVAVVFQQMMSGMNVFSFLAIPFFVFSGELMLHGGVARRGPGKNRFTRAW